MNLEKHIKKNVINGRSLGQYEHYLSFDKEILRGKKVLNFGCGGSNIGNLSDIKDLGIEWVDVDILPDPISVHEEGYDYSEDKFLKGVNNQRVRNSLEGLTDEWISDSDEINTEQPAKHRIERARKKVMEDRLKRSQDAQLSFPVLNEYENSIFGIENRNFMQFNGKQIQIKNAEGQTIVCPDNYFDYGFLSWVIHQISEKDFPIVFKELMRTCKNLIISPIWGKNIFDIEHMIDGTNYEIKSVNNLPYNDDYKSRPILKNEKDIENLRNADFHPTTYPDIDYGERPQKVNAHGAGVIFLHKNLI